MQEKSALNCTGGTPWPPLFKVAMSSESRGVRRDAATECSPYNQLSCETRAVFGRADERLHHLRLLEVSVEAIELREPELVTALVRIPSQVSEVLHHHKRLITTGFNEVFVLSYAQQNICPG